MGQDLSNIKRSRLAEKKNNCSRIAIERVIKTHNRNQPADKQVLITAFGKAGTNKGKKFDNEWRNKISDSLTGKTRGRARKFGGEIEKEICEIYKSGVSTYELEKIYDTSRSAISKILDRNSVNKRESIHINNRSSCQFSIKQEKEIFSIYENGCSNLSELARKFNTNYWAVKRIIDIYGKIIGEIK